MFCFLKTAFSNDYDYPDYDADYEDENWLNEKKKTLPKDFNQDLLLYFETIMDRLEKVTSHSTIVCFILLLYLLCFGTN